MASIDTQTTPFEDDAARVLRRLRSSLAEILDALPGSLSRPHEVQKALGIDTKLAWKIVNLVQNTELFASARYVPGPSTLKSFLKAAAKRDVSAALIREGREAGADFERLSRVHAGNPASLKMMLTACATDRSAADIKHKKMAFQANSYIYGIQARTRLAACFLQPAAERGLIDIAWLCGHVDLCWLRSNARWIMSSSKKFDNGGAAP